LDDVIVIGRTFEVQLGNLRKVFRRLREVHLKLNPAKCQLYRKEARSLGHIVSTSEVITDPEKLEAVKSWPRPKDKHQWRSFLGLCTYYRRFISEFSDIAKPLTRQTEENQTFEWSAEAETAYQALKMALCTAPVPGYPRPGERFIIDTDVNNIGNGGVLSQVQDGGERVVCYSEKHYPKLRGTTVLLVEICWPL